jgi:hypothetical protein
MTHTFTPEDTAEHLAGLQASADAIDALISHSDGSNGERDMMDRNVRHIGIMCAMDHLKNCGEDLTPFTDAQARGVAWMAS